MRYCDGQITKEYRAYLAMLNRSTCNGPKTRERLKGTVYENIEIDTLFLGEGGFEAFYQEVGACPDPTYLLDRADNSKGYVSGNLKWSSARESSKNQRRSRMITAFGKTQHVNAWSSETGLHSRTILGRIDVLGWDPEDAVSQPSQKRRHY